MSARDGLFKPFSELELETTKIGILFFFKLSSESLSELLEML
jgi:hypothetical protein